MRLLVVKYTPDEHRSLDCVLCSEDEASQQLTVIIFSEEKEGNSFVLCPEHLDSVVVQALQRHRDGLKDGDPFWYLTEDKDPWDEMWKEERQ